MIKKRNLDNSLIQWIMTATGLGPGIGEIKYVAKADSATSKYGRHLEDNNINDEDLSATLAAAYAKVEKNRNDIILVTPGAYDEAASLDWTKDNTHLMGLGGPNVHSDYSEANTAIYTDTATVDYTIHLTGDHCIFKNLHIGNAGANAGNLAPLYVDGYGNYFDTLGLVGNMVSQQLGDIDCASLSIGTNAHNCVWINCQIGEDCWGARTVAYSGQVTFIGSQPNGGLFENCRFKSQSATATVPMVTVNQGAAGATHIGRGWFWKDCVFSNWNATSTDNNEVFYTNDGAGYWPQLLHNCSAFGYHEWSDNDVCLILGTMPDAADGGGLCMQLSEASP